MCFNTSTYKENLFLLGMLWTTCPMCHWCLWPKCVVEIKHSNKNIVFIISLATENCFGTWSTWSLLYVVVGLCSILSCLSFHTILSCFSSFSSVLLIVAMSWIFAVWRKQLSRHLYTDRVKLTRSLNSYFLWLLEYRWYSEPEESSAFGEVTFLSGYLTLW